MSTISLSVKLFCKSSICLTTDRIIFTHWLQSKINSALLHVTGQQADWNVINVREGIINRTKVVLLVNHAWQVMFILHWRIYRSQVTFSNFGPMETFITKFVCTLHVCRVRAANNFKYTWHVQQTVPCAYIFVSVINHFVGTFSNSTGLDRCIECEEGTYQSLPQQTRCLKCEIGSVCG